MKVLRSTKCSLKFANQRKLLVLGDVLAEYGEVVNVFIKHFWENKTPIKAELLKPIVDIPKTWLSARLRKVAAREAIDMIQAAKERWGDEAVRPTHRGERMCLGSTIASLSAAKDATEFDSWLHLSSIGEKIILDLPIKLHAHFHALAERGVRLESYIVTLDYVQLCFKIQTGPKKPKDQCIGIDTGINALASLSTGEQIGKNVKPAIERIKRCKHGSRGQKRAARALRQCMAEVAKEVVARGSLVVVENLKNITKNTKQPRRRLGKNMRRSIGRWNVRYWQTRLQMTCEDTNVSFRTVSPWKTSQICSSCGFTDRRNRDGEKFLCRNCSHTDNADINAAKNILSRFLTGPYGAGCKPLRGYLSTY